MSGRRDAGLGPRELVFVVNGHEMAVEVKP